LSVVISPANTHDIKLVTDVMDNEIVKRSSPSMKCNSYGKRKLQHVHLDKTYNSKTVRQTMIKLGYAPHILYKRNRARK
jgi:hypothetical protein